MRKITHIVVHHTASARDKTTYEAVNEFHRRKNWGTPESPAYAKISSLGQYCQYHWFITAEGHITQCRSDEEIGWHAGDANSYSIGICMAGWFDPGHDTEPTEAQKQALAALLKLYSTKYTIKPENIVPHRHFMKKTCYGSNLPDDWARKLLANATVNHKLLAMYDDGVSMEKAKSAAQFAIDFVKKASDGKLNLEIDFQDVTDVTFKGLLGSEPNGHQITIVDPVQISSEGARQELEREEQYDTVCLFYNPDKILPKPTNPAHTPFMFAGFTTLQIACYGPTQQDGLNDFFVHEILHAWSTLIRERAKITFDDTVHNYSGVYDPRPEANFSHLIGVVMKPYWAYLQETSEPQPVPEPEPVPQPTPHPVPPTNNDNETTMVTFKKVGEPMIYVAVGGTLIPFATDWETYQKDFDKAILVELPATEFAKYKIATAVKITSK